MKIMGIKVMVGARNPRVAFETSGTAILNAASGGESKKNRDSVESEPK